MRGPWMMWEAMRIELQPMHKALQPCSHCHRAATTCRAKRTACLSAADRLQLLHLAPRRSLLPPPSADVWLQVRQQPPWCRLRKSSHCFTAVPRMLARSVTCPVYGRLQRLQT